MRVLVLVEQPPLRTRLAQVFGLAGYVAILASGDRSETLARRNLGAAIVAPSSFDPKGLALARELCGEGCKVIVLSDSSEAVAAVSRIIPDAHAFRRAQSTSRDSLISLPRSHGGEQRSYTSNGPTVWGAIARSGRSRAFNESGRDVPLTMRSSSCWRFTRAQAAGF